MSEITNSCPLPNIDPLYDSDCSNSVIGIDGPPISPVGASTSCEMRPDGRLCPVTPVCSPWDIAESPEGCIIDDYIQEQLNIAGAPLNVHKLLGVHEQGILQDVTGHGLGISSGNLSNFPPANAFDKFVTEWRSAQTGADVISASYIGYDFGPIKLANGRNRYGLETYLKKDISTIRIKQSCNQVNRATKLRIERSADGSKWFGVAVIDVEDCDGLLTIHFKRTVPSRWWRVRPLTFNGGVDDYWAVQALQLIEYEATHISNIQDKIFMENRDRNYEEIAVAMKCQYTPIDVNSVMAKFGAYFDGEQYILDVSFTQAVQLLGRPFVIGDIVQLPSETQYTPSMQPVLKYLQVEDVTWSTTGYTPQWKPTMQRLTVKPALATQETQDIMGKLTRDRDNTGLFDIDDGNDDKKYQDYAGIAQNINADANTQVPVKGVDYGNTQEFTQEMHDFAAKHPGAIFNRKMNRNRTSVGMDAIPPNGIAYTEADDFPTNPLEGAYHRLTYVNIAPNIPPRLYKWSNAKQRWVYLETDYRFSINADKPLLNDFLNDNIPTKVPIDKQGK